MQATQERNQITEYSEHPNEITYRQPGAGAVNFTKQFTAGLYEFEAPEVIARLLRGELHDDTDKRVKRCDYCQYFWRDDSLRNTKRTCSDECKTGIKTLQRRRQRADEVLLQPEKQPKRRTTRDDYYDFFEYPFWLSEESMVKYDSNYISTAGDSVELIESMNGKNRIYGEGNRKVNTSGEPF